MGEAADDTHDVAMNAYDTQMQAIRNVQKDCKYVFCSAGQAQLNKDGLWECYCGYKFEI